MIIAKTTYTLVCDNCKKQELLNVENTKNIRTERQYGNYHNGSQFVMPDHTPNQPKLPPLWYETPMKQLVCSEQCLMEIHDKQLEKWKKEQRDAYHKNILNKLKK